MPRLNGQFREARADRGRRSAVVLMTMGYLISAPVAAQDAATDASSITDDLDRMMTVPLPGEPPRPAMTDRDRLSALVGRTIVRVSSPDATPELNPVADANIPLGLEFSRALVRKAVRRLWETGRYRDVVIRAIPVKDTGVELVIGAAPMLRVGKIETDGNSALTDDEVKKVLGYAPGHTILPDPALLKSLRHKLLSVYAKKGYREAKASLSILTTEELGTVVLSVTITEGRPERYTTIDVQGLPSELNDHRVLKRETVRDREQVNAATETLKKTLAQAGYFDAEVLPFEERQIDRYRWAITIPVDAKLRSEIRFRGNRHFLASDLLEVVNSDDTLQTKPESLLRREDLLKQHLRAHGYFFADVRAERRCIGKQNQIRIHPLTRLCQPGTVAQEIVFAIQEGPNVEVVDIRTEGNRWFSDDEIQEELFAFSNEKNTSKDVFQPLSPKAVDDLGLSDKRPDGNGSTRVIKAPRFKRARVYVPEQYAEAMDHLTGLYQEQGFLFAAVKDTCSIQNRSAVTHKGRRFVPLIVHRAGESDENGDTANRSPCVFVNEDRDQLLLMLTVNEGVQTTLNEIRFTGNRAVSSAKLQRITRLSISAPYNEYRLKEAARALRKAYRDLGYMFVDVSFEKRFSEDMYRAKVVFTIKEGPEVRVGMIRIEGAETTSKQLIKERLTLEKGELITPEELEKSQVRIMELGIFNGATVQMVSPEVPDEVKNLKIQVSEAKPQYLEFRWGVATVEGLRTGLEYGFNNIGGYALAARFRARANYRLFFVGNPEFEERYDQMRLVDQLEHHVLVGLGSPHLPGTKGLLGWGIDAVKERLNKPGFSADRLTTFLKLNTPLAIGTKYPHGFIIEARTGFEYNIAIEQGLSNNPFLLKYLRLPDGESGFYVVGLNFTLDLRDSPFNPSEGFFLSIGADWVRSVPVGRGEKRIPGDPVPVELDSNLLRGRLTASGYITAFDTDLVIALSFSVGYIFHLQSNSTTWPDRYFYVGGIDTLRGFPEDSLVPQDLYDEWKRNLGAYGEDIDNLLDTSGGEAMFVTRGELRYPLAQGFYGAAFAEFGNVWRDREKMFPFSLRPFKVNLRPVAGLGIRYQTPLGPISLDVGINLFRRPREDPFSWYLSIGTAF